MQMNLQADFSTQDIHVAAYLLALDRPFRGLSGQPGHRTFTFANVAPEDVQGFYAGVKVDARKLLGALRDLKGLLAQGDRR
jgi:hypothetical protein